MDSITPGRYRPVLHRCSVDNTVQDEPAWSISTTRGSPRSEKTEFNRPEQALHEYHFRGDLKRTTESPRGPTSARTRAELGPNVAAVFTNDWWVSTTGNFLQAKAALIAA